MSLKGAKNFTENIAISVSLFYKSPYKLKDLLKIREKITKEIGERKFSHFFKQTSSISKRIIGALEQSAIRPEILLNDDFWFNKWNFILFFQNNSVPDLAKPMEYWKSTICARLSTSMESSLKLKSATSKMKTTSSIIVKFYINFLCLYFN